MLNPMLDALLQSSMGQNQAAPPAMLMAPQGPRPVVRPSIATTIYRADPRTREFVFNGPTSVPTSDSGQEAPGSRLRMEDQLSYLQQRMMAAQEAGGTLDNSPQLQQWMPQAQALSSALGDMSQAEAQMAQARAQQTQADAQKGKIDFDRSKEGRRLVYATNPGAMAADPQGYADVGGTPDPAAHLQSFGINPKGTLADALNQYARLGRGPLVPGSPEHQSIAKIWGPELDVGMAGDRKWIGELPWTTSARTNAVKGAYPGGLQPGVPIGTPAPTPGVRAPEPPLQSGGTSRAGSLLGKLRSWSTPTVEGALKPGDADRRREQVGLLPTRRKVGARPKGETYNRIANQGR